MSLATQQVTLGRWIPWTAVFVCAGLCAWAAEHCGNGIDDDQDGMADCADVDCANDYCYCGAGFSVFLRGDADGTGKIDITDALVVLRYLFLGQDPPACLDAADTDDSNSIEVTDAVRILGYLFRLGFAPAPPFPECGGDEDSLLGESPWPPCRQEACCP